MVLSQVEADLSVGDQAEEEPVAVVGLAGQLVVAAAQALRVPGQQEIVPSPQTLSPSSTEDGAEVPHINIGSG